MTTLKSIGLVITGLVIGSVISLALTSGGYGGVYNQVNNEFFQGLKAGSANQFEVQADGDIALTKSTFCMQLYATSTATLVKMVASSTATIEGTDGVFVLQYGACS